MANPLFDWYKAAHFILLSRELDILEEQQLTPQGKITFQFSAKGHELAQVVLALFLDHSHDAASVYYRSRPFMLASGLTVSEALAANMGRINSPSEGRDGGVIYNMHRSNGLTVLPATGGVGGQYTPAVGWAQAILYRQQVLGEQEWANSVIVVLGGDGSVASNGFWSALNIATTRRLPLLFVILDNKYGLSVPSWVQTPNGNIAANLASFGNLEVLEGDGTDPALTVELVSTAIGLVRSGSGPCLLRLNMPRLCGHTFIDDQAYKSEQERASEAERDPVQRLQAYLFDQGILSTDDWTQLVADVHRELEIGLREVESFPQPNINDATKHLFFDGQAPCQGGLRPEISILPLDTSVPTPQGSRLNLIDSVRKTLEHEMDLNPRILVFGEDVGVKGGVHGATMDMQSRFGCKRVFDTSLSEEGIIGRAVGMALAGLLPVPEIQFRKYADSAHEQINDLGTMRWRTANKFAAPVVVRIPVGYGKKGGDPWHCASGESIFAHTLGWRIAFPSNAEDAVGLLRTALRGDDPTFFFEHRALLDTADGRRPYPGDDYCLPFGRASVLTKGDQLTLVTWGAMVHRCLAAAEEFPGLVRVVDLRTIIPWDKETVLRCVRQTGKVLVIHEDTYTAGFAGEIIATIAEQAFLYLDAPVQRLTTPDVPIPFNVPMMKALLPSVERIQEKMGALLAF